MRPRSVLVTLVIVIAIAPAAAANGHGPVFGGATPTVGKGAWQFDQAWMGRIGEGFNDDEHMLRTMISFGVTPDLQISASLPVTLESGFQMPKGRLMSMMASTQDFETIVAWRFHRQGIGPGARLESTAFVGFTTPLQHRRPDGMVAARSFHATAATGYVSRSHYFWVSGGHQRTAERDFSRVGNTSYYSVVYGYRPPALQLDYPKPDLRFFVEAVGQRTARAKHFGSEMIGSGGKSLHVGPTLLLLYKAFGFEAGMQFPVYQDTDSFPAERFRFGANVTYVFLPR